MTEFAAHGLDQLRIPPAIRADLATCLGELVQMSPVAPVSIVAIGSAVTGDYAEKSSDLNLLVVYEELRIEDLGALAPAARRWFRKRRFSPRFLSRRNLVDTARYFQIDFLGMRDAHVVLHGEDVLSGLVLLPADLRWQLAHEIKRMRMRLKQQYWHAAQDAAAQRAIAEARVGSLLHLYRGVLLLEGRAAPRSRREVADIAARDLGLDAALLGRVLDWKDGKEQPRGDDARRALVGIFAAVVALDQRVERAGT